MALAEPYTKTTEIGEGALEKAHRYISEEMSGLKGLAVCDKNTEYIAEKAFPDLERYAFEAGTHAYGDLGDGLASYITDNGIGYAVAVGSGSVTDLTRYAAHAAKKPFISYPTAASVDGFVSSVAAMTIKARKTTLPSTPPVALFADPAAYMTAPRRLTVSGVCDILGKYISIFDWQAAHYLLGEKLNDEIIDLERRAVEKVLSLDPASDDFTTAVMEGLVMTGMAIQYHGSSRPASGAEHHLSHLWEMRLINGEIDALHGEQVGVSTLIVLDRYKKALCGDIAEEYEHPQFTREFLEPVYGPITDGIIEENTPDPLSELTKERISAAQPDIRRLIEALPDVGWLRGYMLALGCKTRLAEIELPDTAEFAAKSLKYAPFVRRRITLLKILRAEN